MEILVDIDNKTTSIISWKITIFLCFIFLPSIHLGYYYSIATKAKQYFVLLAFA